MDETVRQLRLCRKLEERVWASVVHPYITMLWYAYGMMI